MQQKRKEYLLKAAEKINEKRTAKFQKIRTGNLKEEEKLIIKEKKLYDKEMYREKARQEIKE